jgi:hypothetical protein
MRILFLSFLILFLGSHINAQYVGSSPFCHENGGLMINELFDGTGANTTTNPGDFFELLVILLAILLMTTMELEMELQVKVLQPVT